MKALDKIQEISKRLSTFNIEDPATEAGILLRQGLDMDLVMIYRDNPDISAEQTAIIEEMLTRRGAREPLQYIAGQMDFFGLKIVVGQGVLIPRPETELMAEQAVRTVKSVEEQKSRSEKLTMLDLCTGSGCLALALAKNFPDSEVCGIDISGTALEYAKKNAEINGVSNVEFLEGHLFSPLGQNMVFDFIISNPPYISRVDIKDLQPEIKDWEPLNALDGGEDGLDFYREIIPAAREFLKDQGTLMFEVGYDGADGVAAIFRDAGYGRIQITEDYSEIKRVVSAKWIK